MSRKSFKRVLIANRGEIAVRIARTLKEMGITPVAVYSEVDRIAPHVRACDLAYPIGPAPAVESYLRADKLIEVAKAAKVDAIHPGYGFLSENAAFSDLVNKSGLSFIGPSAEAMRIMGSKTGARKAVVAAGVPVVPGSDGPVTSVEDARETAKRFKYPVMIKASAGGGGKGMRIVHAEADMAEAFRAARSEAKSAFGDDSVYIEKAIIHPKHIEIQIFGGPDGKCVYLGERECSMQRRHQKIIEETPSLAVSDALRKRMGEVACKAAEAVNYVGAGTCEFLLDQEGNFYFLEMNTRLQVEHPVTEWCTGYDLVKAQVLVAQGEPLPWRQDEIAPKGHSIEARIYAEDPARNFMPSPGHILEVVFPQGPGVRVDSGVASGFEVPRFYDPMIAKISVWANDRESARRKLVRALSETAVKGLTTNTAFLRDLLEHPSFIKGDYHTSTVAEALAAPVAELSSELIEVAIAAAVVNTYRRDTKAARQVNEREGGPAWRSGAWRRGGG